MSNARPVKYTADDFNYVVSDAVAEDTISLESVEAVAAYRTWVKADARFYNTPREQRTGKAPRMPKLPAPTDYKHARAFEAL